MNKMITILLVLVLQTGPCMPTQLFASPATPLLKGLSKFLSKEAASEMTEKVIKEIGEESLERISSRLLREGGETTLDSATKLLAKHGPDVLRAIDNAPNPKQVLSAIDDLPVDKVPDALLHLARGQSGKELAEATGKYGPKALKAELEQPGVGRKLLEVWPDDGVNLCKSLNKEQAISLGRYSDDLMDATPAQKKGVLEIITSDKDAFFKWLGKFTSNNPGKILTATVILANSDLILGDTEPLTDPDGRLILDPYGKPLVFDKPGLLGRFMNPIAEKLGQPVANLITIMSMIIAGFTSLFLAFKLFFWVRRKRTLEQREINDLSIDQHQSSPSVNGRSNSEDVDGKGFEEV